MRKFNRPHPLRIVIIVMLTLVIIQLSRYQISMPAGIFLMLLLVAMFIGIGLLWWYVWLNNKQ